MSVYFGESSSSEHHAVIVAAAGDCLVFIGQNDVPMSCGGVEGEPGDCRKEKQSGTIPHPYILDNLRSNKLKGNIKCTLCQCLKLNYFDKQEILQPHFSAGHICCF